MKNKIQGLLVGILLGTLLSGTAVFAAGGTMIEVFFNVEDIKVNEISRMPESKPFMYNGTTYVPLRFIAESLDVPVSWEASTRTVHIGEKEEGTVVYLGGGLKYLSYQESTQYSLAGSAYQGKADLGDPDSTMKDNLGEEYDHFL